MNATHRLTLLSTLLLVSLPKLDGSAQKTK